MPLIIQLPISASLYPIFFMPSQSHSTIFEPMSNTFCPTALIPSQIQPRIFPPYSTSLLKQNSPLFPKVSGKAGVFSFTVEAMENGKMTEGQTYGHSLTAVTDKSVPAVTFPPGAKGVGSLWITKVSLITLTCDPGYQSHKLYHK